MVDADGLIAQKIVDFIDGVSDDRTADVSDVERLGDVGRREFHDGQLSLSQFAAAVIVLLLRHGSHRLTGELTAVHEHIHVGVDLFHLGKQLTVGNLFRHACRDHLGRLAHGLCQAEAGESVVSHLCIAGNFDDIPDFVYRQSFHRSGQHFGNLSLKINH